MKVLTLLPLSVAVLSATSAWGATPPNRTDDTVELDAIYVRASGNSVLTGLYTTDRESIKNRPSGNGNVTDLLKTNPAVQFSNRGASGLTAGEIAPEKISINGSQPFQNNFMMDGVSMTNDLDPGPHTEMTVTRVGSDTQGMFLDASLIDSIAVYSSNVPASYGAFTGGVVDARMKRWTGENHWSVYGRTTQKGWTRLHFDPALGIDNVTSPYHRPGAYQTDFKKREVGFNGTVGFTEDVGMILAVSHRESEIPQASPSFYYPSDLDYDFATHSWNNLTLTQVPAIVHKTKRQSDNLFLKGTAYVGDRTTVEASAAYSTYRNKGFLPTSAQSDFEMEHNGLTTKLDVTHVLDHMTLTANLSYADLRDKRESDVNDSFVYNDSTTYPVKGYRYGGIGTLSQRQQTLTAKLKGELEPLTVKGSTHRLSAGLDLAQIRAQYHRPQPFYQVGLTVMPNWSGPGLVKMPNIVKFGAGTAKADYHTEGLWVEDQITWNRWSFRPGLRIDRDGFTKRTNVAPRLSAAVDVFGDDRTVITAGLNRYYGRAILAYAFWNAQNAHMFRSFQGYGFGGREDNVQWQPMGQGYDLEKLKTPYDDEVTVGVQQRFLKNWTGTLAYTRRAGKDRIKSVNVGSALQGDAHKVFNNDGEALTQQVTAQIKNHTPIRIKGIDHTWTLSASYNKNRSSLDVNDGYVDTYTVGRIKPRYDKVWYEGKLVDPKDLPGQDYTVPVKLSLEMMQSWEKYGLTFFNTLEWNSARNVAEKDGDGVRTITTTSSVEQVRAYKKVRYPSTFTWNTKLSYKPQFAKGLTLSLEVDNVTDRKNVAGFNTLNQDSQSIDYTVYQPGRQFWLQVNYQY